MLRLPLHGWHSCAPGLGCLEAAKMLWTCRCSLPTQAAQRGSFVGAALLQQSATVRGFDERICLSRGCPSKLDLARKARRNAVRKQRAAPQQHKQGRPRVGTRDTTLRVKADARRGWLRYATGASCRKAGTVGGRARLVFKMGCRSYGAAQPLNARGC